MHKENRIIHITMYVDKIRNVKYEKKINEKL